MSSAWGVCDNDQAINRLIREDVEFETEESFGCIFSALKQPAAIVALKPRKGRAR